MEHLTDIMSRVLNIEKSNITEELSRDNCAEWDSFNHLLLINEIEKELNVTFAVQEVERINTFKELSELLELKFK